MKHRIILLMAVAALAGCKGRNQAGQEQNKEVNETVVSEIADIHNSRNSLDYEGTYKGILPCADCEGIETTVTLDKEGNFTRTMKYLGKGDDNEFVESGKYEWMEDGNVIKLQTEDEGGLYQVGEDRLFHLDINGNRITGDLADYYVLAKQQNE